MPASAPATAPAATASPLLLPRLVTLWALSEALLGGVLHAFKLPVTGIFVGGASLVLIQLLGHYGHHRGTVLRGLLVVLTIKTMLSPHSPPTAYVAVAFQGLLGEVFSWGRGLPRLRGLLLGVLTMTESAGQRVLVLWLLFGQDLPAAFNQFVHKQFGIVGQGQDYAILLVAAYFLVHAGWGAVVGWWASGLPAVLPRLVGAHPWLSQPLPAVAASEDELLPPPAANRRWQPGTALLVLWLGLMAVLIIASVWSPSAWLLQLRFGGLPLVRAALVYGGWTLLVAPWLMRALRSWLTQPRGRWAADLQATFALLPVTRQLVIHCWALAGRYRGWRRVLWFTRALAIQVILEPAAHRV